MMPFCVTGLYARSVTVAALAGAAMTALVVGSSGTTVIVCQSTGLIAEMLWPELEIKVPAESRYSK